MISLNFLRLPPMVDGDQDVGLTKSRVGGSIGKAADQQH